MRRPDLSGTTVGGHFDLKKRLGSGHFGDVYRCENTILGHISALKIIPVKASSATAAALEAKLQNLTPHAHIVKVRSATEWQDSAGKDHLLIEMEYVSGGSLEDAIGREISIGELMSLMKNVLFALDHAHPDIIHRDVKPANILLGGGGKLSDFGIAMLASTGASASTYQYTLNLAPECFPPSKTFGVATDIFAAGLTMLRALNLLTNWRATLVPPGVVLGRMKAGTFVASLGFHTRVPPALRKVVKTATAKDPAKRYTTAAAFRDALESLPVTHDWQKVSADVWECEYHGAKEQLVIQTAKGSSKVDYTRNGRRKLSLHKSGLTHEQAQEYVYEQIAATTFA